MNKSILGPPGLHFGPFFMTFGSHFGIDFSLFFWMTYNQEKCLFFNTVQWFWTIKNHWFSDRVFIDFSCFFKTAPRRRTFLKSWFWVSFSIFMVFKKASFGRPFRPSRRQNPSPPKYGERPFRDPAFHETTVILMPLGPSVFKNIIFSMTMGYFYVFSAFLCAMFYMPFLSHLMIKPW